MGEREIRAEAVCRALEAFTIPGGRICLGLTDGPAADVLDEAFRAWSESMPTPPNVTIDVRGVPEIQAEINKVAGFMREIREIVDPDPDKTLMESIQDVVDERKKLQDQVDAIHRAREGEVGRLKNLLAAVNEKLEAVEKKRDDLKEHHDKR